MSTQNILCRYYQYGYCHQGDSCNFSHDYKSTTPSQVCRYYLKGKCPFDKKCRYDHVKPNKLNNISEACNDSIPTTSKSITTLDDNHLTKNKEIKHLETNSKMDAVDVNKSEFKHDEKENKLVKNHTSKSKLNPNAKEFFPNASSQTRSYLGVLMADAPIPDSRPLCPYLFDTGECSFSLLENGFSEHVNSENKCGYVHGEFCDICQKYALHPFNTDQRKDHMEACCKEMQLEMEFAFAVQRSEEKSCGICLEKVVGTLSGNDGKEDDAEAAGYNESFSRSNRKFGILPNCQHCYCLSCIMEWRNTKNQTIDHTNVRSCPECRVQSYFIIPSKIWVEDKAEKEKMIEDYKKSMSEKPCKYFLQGTGICPLNDICFYKHAYPDGTIAPRNTGGPRRRFNANGGTSRGRGGRGGNGLTTELLLWDFFASRFDSIEFLSENFDFLSMDPSEALSDEEDVDFYGQDVFDTDESDSSGGPPLHRYLDPEFYDDGSDFFDGGEDEDILFLTEVNRNDVRQFYENAAAAGEGRAGFQQGAATTPTSNSNSRAGGGGRPRTNHYDNNNNNSNRFRQQRGGRSTAVNTPLFSVATAADPPSGTTTTTGSRRNNNNNNQNNNDGNGNSNGGNRNNNRRNNRRRTNNNNRREFPMSFILFTNNNNNDENSSSPIPPSSAEAGAPFSSSNNSRGNNGGHVNTNNNGGRGGGSNNNRNRRSNHSSNRPNYRRY